MFWLCVVVRQCLKHDIVREKKVMPHDGPVWSALLLVIDNNEDSEMARHEELIWLWLLIFLLSQYAVERMSLALYAGGLTLATKGRSSLCASRLSDVARLPMRLNEREVKTDETEQIHGFIWKDLKTSAELRDLLKVEQVSLTINKVRRWRWHETWDNLHMTLYKDRCTVRQT